jgi:uncharacterized protein involved in outer membrane biogenesis
MTDAAPPDSPSSTPAPPPEPTPGELRVHEPVRKARRRRAGFIAGGVALALVLAVGVCEMLRWPFLVKPVENFLSQTLKRPVLLQDEGGPQRAGVRFIGSLRVWVPVVQIAAPAWSDRPFFLRAEQAQMRLRYSDLWQARGGGALDIDRLVAQHVSVHAERRADGQASWMFGDASKKKPDEEPRDFIAPNIRELAVRQGELTFQDAILSADLRGQLVLTEGANVQADQRGLRATAQGRYGPAEVNATLNAAGVQPLLATGEKAQPTKIQLQAKAGRAQMRFDGTVTDVLHFRDMQGDVRASGPSLAAVGDPLGVTLPTTGPFYVQGRIAKAGKLWRFDTESSRVGQSVLRAALRYDTGPAKPLLSGQVSSPRFVLADLLPAVAGEPTADTAPPVNERGKPAARASRVIPDKEFDLPSLRAMDANVAFAFDRAELGSAFAMPLQPMKAQLQLNDGKLLIKDIDARTADGNVIGDVALDGTGEVALYRVDLRWSGVRLERWIKQERGGDAPPYISGRLVGRAQLQGKGRSTAQILGSLEGQVFAALRGGRLSHLVVEGAGLDIAQALGVFIKGDEALPVECGVVDMVADGGVFKPRAAVIDTPDSTIWVDGQLSLANESLDLRAIVSPKDFSPLALRTPLRVQGSFGAPDISLQKDKLGRKLAGAVVLALVNPLAAVLPLIDAGQRDENDADACPALLERGRRAAGLKKG